MKHKYVMRRALSTVGAFTIAMSLYASPVLAAEVDSAYILEIVSVETTNSDTSTGQASTVSAVTYKVNGEEKTVTADEGNVLTLVVDGAQEELAEGQSYTVDENYDIVSTKVFKSGSGAPPWEGPMATKAIYNFRQATLIIPFQILNCMQLETAAMISMAGQLPS